MRAVDKVVNVFVVIVLVCALMGGVAQLLFKLATSQGLKVSFELLFNWKLMLGLFLYGLSFVGYLFALSKYNRVSVLYFLIAFSYVVVMLGAYFLLREPISSRMWLGAVLICIGILLISVN